METLYIVMPAYNEEANIEKVVTSWFQVLNDKNDSSRLVVADSGSTDQTHSILLSLQKDNPKIIVLSDTLKQHGPKLMALYNYSIKNEADFIFQTDSDGQTDALDFPAFWKRRDDFFGIFGNRIVRGDGKIRAFVENVVCLLLRLYFGVKVPDANVPFRLMKTETLKKYLNRLPKDYDLPNIMLTTYFAYFKERIAFLPITFRARQGGKNSINLIKIIKIGLKAMQDFHKFKHEMK